MIVLAFIVAVALVYINRERKYGCLLLPFIVYSVPYFHKYGNKLETARDSNPVGSGSPMSGGIIQVLFRVHLSSFSV